MRDAHKIREQGALAAWMGRWLPGVRAVAGMAAAFAVGRATAPVAPDLPVAALPPPAEARHDEAPTTDEAPQPELVSPAAGSSARREAARARKRPASLVASSEPDALQDGLLPTQLGPAGRGEFSVQVASFEQRDEARAFCQQLARRGFHPHVGNKRNHPRPHGVRLGRFSRRQQAEQYRIRLAQADITAAVVQVD